eukprot:TRINITY_DN33337_c0_g1_i1.p1 TRINITY_DN33337_c0_g1~~TRINITY_DN33337_c0_g1_i1.p1  ORF type:complete len:600 (+),score=93.24 TRINITY_DN33337_c0_g1_i1:200-1999(+)
MSSSKGENIKNLLFIVADQFRGDCLGHSHPTVKTPHLDRLVSEGVCFRRHYSQAVCCAPARASMHTGLYMSNHRVVDNGVPLSREWSNWAAELSRVGGVQPTVLGYSDTAVDPRNVDISDPSLNSYAGFLSGANNASVDSKMGSREWLHEQGILGNYGDELRSKLDNAKFESWNGHHGDMAWLREPKGAGCVKDLAMTSDGFPAPAAYPAHCSDTFVLTSEAIDFMRQKQADGQAWALHLSLLKPHSPFLAPEPYNKMYKPSDVDLPSSRARDPSMEATVHPFLAAVHSQECGFPLVEQDTGSIAGLDDSSLQGLRASYYALISEVDDNIGRLLRALEDLGECDNTLVIFTSDHGDLLGEHWCRGKLGFHQGSFHIPLIIKDPRSEASNSRGSFVDAFTENVDLVPTILDYMLGAEHPQCDGMSLRPFMEQPQAVHGWRSAAHYEFDFRYWPEGKKLRKDHGLKVDDCCLTVLQTSTRKLVVFAGGLAPLLFDLEADPGELKNVATDPKFARDLMDLMHEMLSWKMRHHNNTLVHYKVGQQTENKVESYLDNECRAGSKSWILALQDDRSDSSKHLQQDGSEASATCSTDLSDRSDSPI